MSVPFNVGREIVIAAIGGGGTLIRPAGLPPRALAAYRIACATFGGAYTYDVMRKHHDFAGQPLARLAVAAGAAGAFFGTMDRWERLDEALHQRLVARGVRRPRLVLAALTAAGYLGMALLDAKAIEREEGSAATGPSLTDLDPQLRTLLAALLAETDDFSAPALREQLALAQVEAWGLDEDPDEELPAFLDLAVAGAHDVARAVPHVFVFPVHAKFEHDGDTFEISLQVRDGRLSSVRLAPSRRSATLDDSDDESWPTTWPAVDDVLMRLEASTD
jgi:hypothetical protein